MFHPINTNKAEAADHTEDSSILFSVPVYYSLGMIPRNNEKLDPSFLIKNLRQGNSYYCLVDMNDSN